VDLARTVSGLIAFSHENTRLHPEGLLASSQFNPKGPGRALILKVIKTTTAICRARLVSSLAGPEESYCRELRSTNYRRSKLVAFLIAYQVLGPHRGQQERVPRVELELVVDGYSYVMAGLMSP
jgi:hypothetical protein